MENISICKESEDKNYKIIIGICAMEKKINSRHMQNILKGLEAFEEFQIVVFDEEIIFNYDIEVIILFNLGMACCSCSDHFLFKWISL